MAQRLQQGGGLELGEVRPKDEAERFSRSAHAECADEHQDKDDEQNREEEPRDPFDALLHAEVDDPDGRNAEAEREHQLQAAVAGLFPE